jgi:hypothetical protein
MSKYVSFNVCCDSSNNYVSQVNGSSTQFYFDWSRFPQGRYKVTFSYMSDDTTTTLSPVMTLHTDFNSGDSSYVAGNGVMTNSPCLGVLFPDKHGANGYYYAGAVDNPPVIMYRPNNNFFNVYLRNGLTTTAYSTPVAAQYVLIIHFELVE